MASPAKLEPPPLYPCNQAPEFVEMSLDLLNVYRSELHLNRMTGSTHVYLKSDNGDLAYSISQSGLRNIDKRDLAQHIAKTFAEEIKAKL